MFYKEQKLVLPEKVVDDFLRNLHQHGHGGINDLVYKVNRYDFYFPTLRSRCEEVVKSCVGCRLGKVGYGVPKLSHLPSSSVPFEFISVDAVKIDDNNILFLIVDMATSFLNAYHFTSFGGKEVLRSLENHGNLFGFPNRILSDNGREYSFGPISDWTHLHGVCWMYTGVYHPQSNGKVERNSRTVTEALRATLLAEFSGHSDRDIDMFTFIQDNLSVVLSRINSTPKGSSDQSPRDLVFSYKEKCPVLPSIPSTQIRPDYKGKFKVGDRVLYRVQLPDSKMSSRFSSPSTVVDVVGNYLYEIVSDESTGSPLRIREDRLVPCTEEFSS